MSGSPAHHGAREEQEEAACSHGAQIRVLKCGCSAVGTSGHPGLQREMSPTHYLLPTPRWGLSPTAYIEQNWLGRMDQ